MTKSEFDRVIRYCEEHDKITCVLYYHVNPKLNNKKSALHLTDFSTDSFIIDDYFILNSTVSKIHYKNVLKLKILKIGSWKDLTGKRNRRINLIFNGSDN